MNVAILSGGLGAEREISLKSAQLIKDHLPAKYVTRTILIEGRKWYDQETGIDIDKNDFSLNIDGQKLFFNVVYMAIHGDPAENGKIQGYFEILGIPYTGSDTLVTALTFNKQVCKDYLQQFGVYMAPSILLTDPDNIEFRKIEQMGFPLFVKPNQNGSSYGISKAHNQEELLKSIGLAFDYDTEVMVEAFMEGREYSVGVVRRDSEIHVFPVTEIISENDFFDYEAKYLDKSEEITPARLPDAMSDAVRAESLRQYKLLKCAGMVRFDYILVGEHFYFLEVNTVPGLSEQSIIPQQALAYGWSIGDLLVAVIEESMNE
jgi:D-alanine-D-alanine ligase